jgi:hypothetical protein
MIKDLQGDGFSASCISLLKKEREIEDCGATTVKGPAQPPVPFFLLFI